LECFSTGVLLRKMADDPFHPDSAEMQAFLASGGRADILPVFYSSLELMDDARITDILFNAFSHAADGWILDGYPRTVEQARILDERLAAANAPLTAAVMLDIPKETIVERIADRWAHQPSGRTYSYTFNPPKTAGLDDLTGEPLVKRSDDHMVSRNGLD